MHKVDILSLLKKIEINNTYLAPFIQLVCIGFVITLLVYINQPTTTWHVEETLFVPTWCAHLSSPRLSQTKVSFRSSPIQDVHAYISIAANVTSMLLHPLAVTCNNILVTFAAILMYACAPCIGLLRNETLVWDNRGKLRIKDKWNEKSRWRHEGEEGRKKINNEEWSAICREARVTRTRYRLAQTTLLKEGSLEINLGALAILILLLVCNTIIQPTMAPHIVTWAIISMATVMLGLGIAKVHAPQLEKTTRHLEVMIFHLKEWWKRGWSVEEIKIKTEEIKQKYLREGEHRHLGYIIGPTQSTTQNSIKKIWKEIYYPEKHWSGKRTKKEYRQFRTTLREEQQIDQTLQQREEEIDDEGRVAPDDETTVWIVQWIYHGWIAGVIPTEPTTTAKPPTPTYNNHPLLPPMALGTGKVAPDEVSIV